MKCFPVQTTYPIFINQLRFTDKFSSNNAFFEMNPSFWLDASGSFILLVRCINYRKFMDRTFTIYNTVSESKYFIFRGIWEDNKPFSLENCEQKELQIESPYPLQPTYWYGVEDIRFISEKQVLATIPQYTFGGHPSMFLCSLEDSILRVKTQCQPSKQEKNWMPIDSSDYVIYSCSPLYIKRVLTDEKKHIETPEVLTNSLKEYHGSTNTIEFQNGILCLIHKNEARSVHHRWFWISNTLTEFMISEPFVFFAYTYIEFPISLVKRGDSILVSVGINDDKALLLSVKPNDIYESIKHSRFGNTIDSL